MEHFRIKKPREYPHGSGRWRVATVGDRDQVTGKIKETTRVFRDRDSAMDYYLEMQSKHAPTTHRAVAVGPVETWIEIAELRKQIELLTNLMRVTQSDVEKIAKRLKGAGG